MPRYKVHRWDTVGYEGLDCTEESKAEAIAALDALVDCGFAEQELLYTQYEVEEIEDDA